MESSSSTSRSPNPPNDPLEGAKANASPFVGGEASEVTLWMDVLEMLVRQGRRAAWDVAERGPSGEARDDMGEVL